MKSFREERIESESQRTPITRDKLKEKQRLSQQLKLKYIKDLEERNNKLKVEIIHINELLAEQAERNNKKEEHKLIPFESNSEVLKKQLQNAYKQIRNYQKDIKNLQARQEGGLVVEKLSKLENVIKQKNIHIQKLKGELLVLSKDTNDNSRKLKDNISKQQIELMIVKYNQQIKCLRQKVREAQNKQKKKQQNAKKQYEYIKKVEKQLIEAGVSVDELEDLKKNNVFNMIFEKNSDAGSVVNRLIKGIGKKDEEEDIEKMDVDKYNQLRNQIKVYKKLHFDYDRKIEDINKQKADYQKKTIECRMNLVEKQNQIIQLEKIIVELKKKIKRSNLKPNISTITTTQVVKQKPKEKIKMVGTKLKTKSIVANIQVRYDQKGIATDKGKRFSDRSILGKNVNSRITSIKIWSQKSTFNLCGIQCTYKIGQQKKVGGEYLKKEASQYYVQNIFELPDGDYLKNISGALSPNNIIQYLVFISAQARIGRYGIAKPNQKQFNFDIQQFQVPVCVYGSLSSKSEPGKPDISLIEFLGFEITQDSIKDYLQQEDKDI